MDIQTIVNQMGIEILAFLVCMFFGIRLIITRDVKILKKENPESIKHPNEYTFFAGLIIIFLGISAIAMGIVSFFNQIAALIVIVVAVVIMGFMWKIVYEKYAE
jgi:hypothetical protein